MPSAPTRYAPLRCAKRPPMGPSTIIGSANRLTPALAIHSGPLRSSIMMDHNESKVPIIKNRASPMRTAPDTAGMRSKSKAKCSRGRSARAVSGTSTRIRIMVTTKTEVLMMMNGAAIPKVSTVKTEMTGPRAKPAMSTLSNFPKLPPRFSGSATMTILRNAGNAIPPPIPISERPRTRIGKVSPNPMIKQPMMTKRNPVTIRALARPRSASGAIDIWLRKAEKKPIAKTNPNPDSLIPYSSR